MIQKLYQKLCIIKSRIMSDKEVKDFMARLDMGLKLAENVCCKKKHCVAKQLSFILKRKEYNTSLHNNSLQTVLCRNNGFDIEALRR